MRAVLTRVKHASVTIDGKVHGQIGEGFLILLGITHEGYRGAGRQAGGQADGPSHLRG